MPSPFPGMDPYLEAPDIWPDFHDRLAYQISDVLNTTLPVLYYARLEMRPEVGIVEDGGATRRILPDVAVVRQPQVEGATGGIAVLDAPRTTISKSVEVTVRSELIAHKFVEIRDPTRGHRLITLIEIVSPSNKRRGEDRKMYIKKQEEVLDSDASLIELDLLRTGERLFAAPELSAIVARLEPPPDYLVLVNRAWRRATPETAYQVFPIGIGDILPCIPVPLREGQQEVPLDLQFVFKRVYDSGPYRRGAFDYRVPPAPPLSGETAAWADKLLLEAGLRPAP